jgi:hypothetical protein
MNEGFQLVHHHVGGLDLGQVLDVSLLGLACQVNNLALDRALGAAEQQSDPAHARPRDGKLENALVQVWPVLLANGFLLRGGKIPIARLTLVDRHGLVVMLRLPVALLSIEAHRWIRVVRAGHIGAHRARVLHLSEGIKSTTIIKYLIAIAVNPMLWLGLLTI